MSLMSYSRRSAASESLASWKVPPVPSLTTREGAIQIAVLAAPKGSLDIVAGKDHLDSERVEIDDYCSAFGNLVAVEEGSDRNRLRHHTITQGNLGIAAAVDEGVRPLLDDSLTRRTPVSAAASRAVDSTWSTSLPKPDNRLWSSYDASLAIRSMYSFN